MAAPTENVKADVSAAGTGRRGGDFRNPKLIVGVRGQGILGHQLLGDCRASARLTPRST